MPRTDRYLTENASRYAMALYQLGMTENEAAAVSDLLENVPELYDVLSDPTVEKQTKLKIAERVFGADGTCHGAGISETAAGFTAYLIREGRFSLVFQILDALCALLRKKRETAEATLFFTTPPAEEQLSEMEEILKRKLSCSSVHWSFCRDESLLGGFVLQAEGLRYDFSIRGRLDSLRNKVTGRNRT